MSKRIDVQLPESALNPVELSRLKWATTIAVIGIPVMGQMLGAMMLFAEQSPQMTSKPVIIAYCLLAIFVGLAGVYVLLNRMHLRLFGLNRGLDEWERNIQTRAQAFSYKVMLWGMFLAFIFISVLGLLGVLNALPLSGLSLNLAGISALVIGMFYLIIFLPTLYTAWTLKPLTDD